jgi:hypothetical protein
MQNQEGKTAAGKPIRTRSQLIYERNTHFLAFPFDTYSDQFDPKREENALVAYEQAIALAPREAALHYHKGQVLEQLGRLTEAQNAYEVARTLVQHNGTHTEQ